MWICSPAELQQAQQVSCAITCNRAPNWPLELVDLDKGTTELSEMSLSREQPKLSGPARLGNLLAGAPPGERDSIPSGRGK